MIDFILRPFRRNFGKDKRFYAAIDDMFGFIPNNIELYKLALIHKSASVVTEDGRHVNNERLEYLGDAIIESVTSDYLFIEFPDRDEGFLTQLRSKMVSRQTLNDVAKRIGLDDYVISHTSNNVSHKHIYGDAFEAMMGAIYLDQGYDFVNRLLINKIFVDYIKVDTLSEAETDFKSRLIEWCQKNHHTIRFQTQYDKSFSSSSHPTFYSKVLIDNIEVGYGAGDSKKEAEQRAAHSVAHGVSDADCTMLMDKLDSMEMRQQKNARDDKKSQSKEQKSEQKNEQKSEPKVTQKPEPKPEPKPEQKPETKAESKSEQKSEQKSERKPARKAEQKPEQKSEQKSERKAKHKTEPKADKQEELKSEQKSEPQPEKQDKPQGASKPEKQDKPQTEQKSAPRRGRPRKKPTEQSVEADGAAAENNASADKAPKTTAKKVAKSPAKTAVKATTKSGRKPAAKTAAKSETAGAAEVSNVDVSNIEVSNTEVV